MKNLISKTRDGHLSPSVKNEAIGLKFQKTIKYDVWTEVWEFDNNLNFLDILDKTCNDDQEVVFTNIDEMSTYRIINTYDYVNKIRKIINNDEVFESLENTDFFINLPIEAKAGLV